MNNMILEGIFLKPIHQLDPRGSCSMFLFIFPSVLGNNLQTNVLLFGFICFNVSNEDFS